MRPGLRREIEREAGHEGPEKNVRTRLRARIEEHEIIGTERADRPRGLHSPEAPHGHRAEPEIDEREENARDRLQPIGRVITEVRHERGEVAELGRIADRSPAEGLGATGVLMRDVGGIPVEKRQRDDDEQSNDDARDELPVERAEEEDRHGGERLEREGKAEPRGGGCPAGGGDFC